MVTAFPLSSYPALVLNCDWKPLEYLPLSEANWHDSVTAVLKDAVTVVKEYDVEIHSARMTMRLPSVIAMREFVQRRRVPTKSRYNILVLRDRCACGYCGGKFDQSQLTFDHVIPRAQGGKHTWENLIGACVACNQRKRDRTPAQAGMPLLWRPWQPSFEELARANYFVDQKKIHESWVEFLPFAA